MRQLVTKAIVLSRTNFGEADRILSVLTRDFGKISLIAKGVRRAKSKLAGGVELFSISDITFIRGRGEVSTLVSARLDRHFGSIIKDPERLNYAYGTLKLINKNTEADVEAGYFDLLAGGLAELDTANLPLAVTRLSFEASLLTLAGDAPDLTKDVSGAALTEKKTYSFDVEAARLAESTAGQYTAREVKLLRLAFSGNSTRVLARIDGAEAIAKSAQPLVSAMIQNYLRI